MMLKKVFALGYGIHTIKAGAVCRENKELFVKEVCSLFVVNTVLYKVNNLNFYVIKEKHLFLVERSNKHITVSASMLLTALTAKHRAVCSEPVWRLPCRKRLKNYAEKNIKKEPTEQATQPFSCYEVNLQKSILYRA